MKAAITVIRAGLSKNRSFYPDSVLKRDYPVFEGARMFTDHAPERATRDYPGGRVTDWVANLKNVRAENDGTIRGEAVIIDPAFRAKLSALAENNLLGQMGVSIRAYARVETREVEGVGRVRFVDAIESAESVDFVNHASAGGKVESLAESDGHIDDVTGFVESFGSFRAAESISEFRELNQLMSRLGRGPSYQGDEETVADFMRLGFSRDAAALLVESNDPHGTLAAWKHQEFWDACKRLR